jgi:hypothetical protein
MPALDILLAIWLPHHHDSIGDPRAEYHPGYLTELLRTTSSEIVASLVRLRRAGKPWTEEVTDGTVSQISAVLLKERARKRVPATRWRAATK